MGQDEDKGLARKHEEDLQRIRGFRLLDDDFMTKVFEDQECVQFLLQVILERDDLSIKSIQTQYSITNLQGRSVRLDIHAEDRLNRSYAIEIQRNDRGAGVKRARYISSLLDANVTEPGDRYEDLKETYVIFITENDVLGDGLPIYHIDRTIKETGKSFGDEEHIIYVNSQIKDETALGTLMHDFSCTNAKDMRNKVLADRVHYFKETEEGVRIMCKAMEDMRKEERLEVAEKLLALGKLSYEEIADSANLTVDEVRALDEKRSA